MSDDKFIRYFYYPDPDLGSKYIPGVNPSVVKLVDALLSWGVQTTGSHAGFFPGDEEEQEYWSSKLTLEELGLGTHTGPIVCSRFDHHPPSVYFKASELQMVHLRQLLTPGWVINPDSRPQYYRLVYSALQHFSDATNQFWNTFNLQVSDAALLNVNDDAINTQYQAAMPLTPQQYLAERTKAVNDLAQRIYQDIPTQDLATVKARVDARLITLEDYRWLEHRVKQLEARLLELGIEPE